MKKAVISGYICEYSINYNIADTSNIINIHKYLMKKNDIEKCLLYY